MKSEKLLAYIGEIDPAYVDNAERNVKARASGSVPRILQKRLIIPAAATIVLLLTATVFAAYIGGWLNNYTRWEVVDGKLYTEQEKDNVFMKYHVDFQTHDFIFEFAGADNATFTDDGETITIYAQRVKNAEFSMVIPGYIMHGFNVHDRLREAEPGAIIKSKMIDFIVVDDLSSIK